VGQQTNPNTNTATTVSGSTSTTLPFTITGSLTVSKVNPSQVADGASGFPVVLSGSGFNTGTAATVAASGTGVTFSSVSVVSSTMIDANVTAASTATISSRNVTVTQSSTSATCTKCLKVVAAPTITSVSPGILARKVKHTITVTGTGFFAPVTVAFSGPGTGLTGKVTKHTATSLTVSVTVKATQALGAYTLTVNNGNGGIAQLGGAVTIVAAPTLKLVSPNQVTQGQTNVAFTIQGTGYTSDATVTLPTGVSISGVTITATKITGTLSVSSTAPTGAKLPVTVTDGALGGFGKATLKGLTIVA
jgi:hypothetical protein